MGGASSKQERKESEAYKTSLYIEVDSQKQPFIYDDIYNISFFGLEKLHPFDAGKWGRIVEMLLEAKLFTRDEIIRPKEASEDDLLTVHTVDYLDSLKYSIRVAMVMEVGLVTMFPNSIVQRILLKPMRCQTGGTILGAKVSLERGWAIHIGGGFHHCCSDQGGGFCAYADITLAIKFLFRNNHGVKNAMIVDLDAHQGNGHERDFLDDDTVYILDAYNPYIYPGDTHAKRAIRKEVRLKPLIGDEEYLALVKRALTDALGEFRPEFLLYNAGTDILDGDPLGGMSISAKGVIARDEFVFAMARQRSVPILMVTSGGYQRQTARVIADSILNLHAKGLLQQRPCDPNFSNSSGAQASLLH